jgi:hypothetical protein
MQHSSAGDWLFFRSGFNTLRDSGEFITKSVTCTLVCGDATVDGAWEKHTSSLASTCDFVLVTPPKTGWVDKDFKCTLHALKSCGILQGSFTVMTFLEPSAVTSAQRGYEYEAVTNAKGIPEVTHAVSSQSLSTVTCRICHVAQTNGWVRRVDRRVAPS